MKNLINWLFSDTTKKRLVLLFIMGVIVGIVYLIINIFVHSSKFKENKELLNRIDSLDKRLIELNAYQVKLNVIDSVYTIKVDYIANRLDSLKEANTVINKYYYQKSSEVSKYGDKQIDSFLKNRYNY